MPIYEYSCAKCGETTEVIQRFSDPPLKKHDGCGGALRKLLSVPTFQIKANDGYASSTTITSILRTEENRKIAADKKKKKPVSAVSMPAASPPARKPKK